MRTKLMEEQVFIPTECNDLIFLTRITKDTARGGVGDLFFEIPNAVRRLPFLSDPEITILKKIYLKLRETEME